MDGRILKAARVRFAVGLKTAKVLDAPDLQSILLRADKVIE